MYSGTSLIIICSVFSAVAVILNVSLFVIMLRHTPKAFANFGIVMKFQVIVDILANLAGAMVMNRIIPVGSSYVYIAHGPCTLLSSSLCFYSYGIMAMGASMTTYIVLVSFIVRLQIVMNRNPSNRSVCAQLFILTLPVPTLMTVGVEDIRSPTMLMSLSLMIGVLIPHYVVILLLRSKVLKSLEGTGDFLSEKTKAMHSQFVKMLTRQCVIPPVVFFATLVPIQLEHFDFIRHPLLEAMINVLALLSTLLCPMIVLFYIAPYRRALFRLIKGGDVTSLSPNAYCKRLLENTAE